MSESFGEEFPFSFDDDFFDMSGTESSGGGRGLTSSRGEDDHTTFAALFSTTAVSDTMKLPASVTDYYSEAVMHPGAVEKAWLDMETLSGLRSIKGSMAFKVAVITYLIVNSASSRSNFSRQLAVGTDFIDSRIISEILKTNVRRFMNARSNVILAYQIMVNNPSFAEERGRIWGVRNSELWVFCFEGSLRLPDSILGFDQRAMLQAYRTEVIMTSTPYHERVHVAPNNNPASGPVSSGSAGGAVTSDVGSVAGTVKSTPRLNQHLI